MKRADTQRDAYERRRRRIRKWVLLSILLDGLQEERKPKRKFRDKLTLEGRRRRDRKIPRHALLLPKDSPWEVLFNSKDEGSLITVTGFDHNTFGYIHSLFLPYFDGYTPWVQNYDGFAFAKIDPEKSKGRGRKRDVTSISCLGLVLAWYRFRGAEFILQGWFGFTGTQCNVWLRFGRRMLLKALSSV